MYTEEQIALALKASGTGHIEMWQDANFGRGVLQLAEEAEGWAFGAAETKAVGEGDC